MNLEQRMQAQLLWVRISIKINGGRAIRTIISIHTNVLHDQTALHSVYLNCNTVEFGHAMVKRI